MVTVVDGMKDCVGPTVGESPVVEVTFLQAVNFPEDEVVFLILAGAGEKWLSCIGWTKTQAEAQKIAKQACDDAEALEMPMQVIIFGSPRAKGLEFIRDKKGMN